MPILAGCDQTNNLRPFFALPGMDNTPSHHLLLQTSRIICSPNPSRRIPPCCCPVQSTYSLLSGES
ncbi:hypothetical protein I7I50_05348 [Histoplasma capsulatum G186AR]|uniref:Uncharacterized protein n=1 Tax=Ajellomyces capsulatus TaxID=5037 RepID=A0A8H7ZC75_AJECA|nr:hypothetical protein I7I52_03609 [Histoplasma capsulatum]QSS76027.1 hypothetical protein I7I50_05348 [Histoplasma capsulatum G186AR]